MIKSPLNYIGGKYKLLNQILPLFPTKINCFVDLFSGGLDVSLNVKAEKIICNDINNYVIELYKFFKNQDTETLINEINSKIASYRLTKHNKEAYLKLREEYNSHKNPLHLFLLICYGYNHQLRFNSHGEFNNPFGKDRSSYNKNIEGNLIRMMGKIKDFEFWNFNFRNLELVFMQPGDFLYADPPYLISCGSYNDGKRGFEGWNMVDDYILFRKLDELHEKGVNFALSNVIRHKKKENQQLKEWSKKYNIHLICSDYSNSSYQSSTSETEEVLVTNY